MTNPSQPFTAIVEEVLDNLSSREAIFRSKTWTLADKRVAEREWYEIRKQAKLALLQAVTQLIEEAMPEKTDHSNYCDLKYEWSNPEDVVCRCDKRPRDATIDEYRTNLLAALKVEKRG